LEENIRGPRVFGFKSAKTVTGWGVTKELTNVSLRARPDVSIG